MMAPVRSNKDDKGLRGRSTSTTTSKCASTPSPLMFLEMMRLSQPRVANCLREVCREGACAFGEYVTENDDRVFLSLLCDEEELLKGNNNSVDLILKRSPLFGPRPRPTAVATSSRNDVATASPSSNSPLSTQKSSSSSPHSKEDQQRAVGGGLTLSINVATELEKHGATLVHDTATDTLLYTIPCAPLPTCEQMLRVTELFSLMPPAPFTDTPDGAVIPHTCLGNRCRGNMGGGGGKVEQEEKFPCPSPIYVTLGSPMLDRNTFLSSTSGSTHLTIYVSPGGTNIQCAVEERGSSSSSGGSLYFSRSTSGLVADPSLMGFGSSVHRKQEEKKKLKSKSNSPFSSLFHASSSPAMVEFNTLPRKLADLHLGSHAIELKCEPSQHTKLPNDPLIYKHLAGLKRAALTPASLAAAYLNMAERRRRGSVTQRFALPPSGGDVEVCEVCALLPVPIVWAIGPRYLSLSKSTITTPTANTDTVSSVIDKESAVFNGDVKAVVSADGRRRSVLVVDMSELVNVVAIDEYFMADSPVTDLFLPRFVSKELLESNTLGGGGCLTVQSSMPASDPTSSLSWGLTAINSVIDQHLCDVTIPAGMVSMPIDPISAVGSHSIVFPTIANNFLSGCKYLRNVDLEPLNGVARVQEKFMMNCVSLRTLDISPLRHLQRLAPMFLAGCASLEELDLRPLTMIRLFPDGFLNGCASLRQIHFPINHPPSSTMGAEDGIAIKGSGEGEKVVIEGRFMCGCGNIAEVDLRTMQGRTNFAPVWGSSLVLFDRCTSLRTFKCNASSGSMDKAVAAMPAEIRSQLGASADSCNVM